MVRTIPLRPATAFGEALTRDGRYLLVAGLHGAGQRRVVPAG